MTWPYHLHPDFAETLPAEGPEVARGQSSLWRRGDRAVRSHARRIANAPVIPRRKAGLAMSANDPTLDSPREPCVGIFWRVGRVLVIDRSTLAEAEAYGDCLTHAAGHYERWEQCRRLRAPRLAALGLPAQIASTEYDEWPRVKTAFGLDGAAAVVRSDLHYR